MQNEGPRRGQAIAVLSPEMNASFYVSTGKRIFDVAAASFGLLVLSPFLALVALAVKLSSRGPIFFRQVRTGQFGKSFQILKFRSMQAGAHGGSQLTASGDRRVTDMGTWLRRTKIDELPQLLNVIAGDMSLVGPRPEVPLFTSRYTPLQKEVLQARPGITGPSANFHEEELLIGVEDKEQFYVTAVMPRKLEIDLKYCAHITFGTDLYVLYQTFANLLVRIYAPYNKEPHAGTTHLEIHARKK
ncbi:MAG TPA: sugar transferase [Candidatus Acidoferrum sp.]|jgi:lipopolysaccharide/colanic/teichoic acid biosynthesis glycosyltransferase|nr:sugar transferase [Candidatus Acidoferrum sp.]